MTSARSGPRPHVPWAPKFEIRGAEVKPNGAVGEKQQTNEERDFSGALRWTMREKRVEKRTTTQRKTKTNEERRAAGR